MRIQIRQNRAEHGILLNVRDIQGVGHPLHNALAAVCQQHVVGDQGGGHAALAQNVLHEPNNANDNVVLTKVRALEAEEQRFR